MTTRTRMNVYFNPELLAQVEALALRRQVSKSAIIEAAVASRACCSPGRWSSSRSSSSSIQLFVTLIEFKLSTLAGFVLIPFGLFGKTAFMAERVLGNVISSGIKVLVLAVIIGIGSTLFS